MRRLPQKLPLTALRTFEVAARRLSFKDAAEELCVSATTVSNQIRQLESDWDCKLFIRKTRAVVLTDEGRSLSHVVTRAFGDIRAEIDVHMNRTRKIVRLAVGPIFGARWLSPRLAKFQAAQRNIQLMVQHSPRITDAAMMDANLAVDWGDGNWSGLECRHLLDITYSPVLSSELLKSLGGLKAPEDLVRYPIIHQRNRSEWTAWFELAGCSDLPTPDGVTITDTNIVTQAAMDGQGVSLGIFPLMQPDVDANRLIKPFDIDLVPGRSFYLLAKPNSVRNTEVSTVMNWLLAEAAKPVLED